MQLSVKKPRHASLELLRTGDHSSRSVQHSLQLVCRRFRRTRKAESERMRELWWWEQWINRETCDRTESEKKTDWCHVDGQKQTMWDILGPCFVHSRLSIADILSISLWVFSLSNPMTPKLNLRPAESLALMPSWGQNIGLEARWGQHSGHKVRWGQFLDLRPRPEGRGWDRGRGLI